MLELREYTAKELKEIYNTDRIDWIKRKVSREGYTYTGSGRGDNYTMLIESLPKSVDRFKIYCIEELKFDSRINYNLLAEFTKVLFSEEGFKFLQYAEMVRQLNRKGIDINRLTVKKYFLLYSDLNMVATFMSDYIYYIRDEKKDITREITYEEYKAAWEAFREGRYNNANEAIRHLYNISKSTPKKAPKIYENAFTQNQIKTIKEILGVD